MHVNIQLAKTVIIMTHTSLCGTHGIKHRANPTHNSSQAFSKIPSLFSLDRRQDELKQLRHGGMRGARVER